ncbi:MAG: Multidrug resistance ABC transporter ATP-binding/permease protein BmrA [Alphaproteobacteria bacterium ADurb.BinA305]|nr:MAG: Multidrug resistance ABC transporter ATP-binding/permease protein BmrA [Alphaproteobacteria bacterium ADurb.BinA305]
MPSDTASPAPLSALRGLLPFLRPYRARVVLAFVFLCLGSAAILVVPLAFRDLIDAGFGGVSVGGAATGGAADGGGLFGAQGLDGRFVALFGLAVFWAAAVAARYYTVSWIGERVTADLRSAVYARVLRQSPQYFETLQTGEVLSRLTGDTTLVQTVVGSSISLGLRSLFQFVGGMLMLAVTSVQLFGLIFGLMALLALPITLIGRRVRSLSREAQDRIADASALAGEILAAMPTVQAFGQEDNEAARFAARAETSFAAAVRRTRVRAALTGLIIAAVMGTIIFVLWIGARQVQAGALSVGDLGAFVIYAALVAGGAGTLAEVWGDVMRAAGASGRLLELLQAEPVIRDAEAAEGVAEAAGGGGSRRAPRLHENPRSTRLPPTPRSSSPTSSSATLPAPPCQRSTASTCASRWAKGSRWSAPRAPARPACSSSCCASTRPARAASASTARTSARCRCEACVRVSPSCPRTR